MSDEIDGPEIRIELSCFPCKHVKTEHYACQSDSGTDWFCAHPEAVAPGANPKRRIDGYGANTPGWCPLRHARLREALDQAQEHLARDLDSSCGP